MNATAGSITAVLNSAKFNKVTNNRIEILFHFENDPTCALYGGELAGPDSVYAAEPHYGLPAVAWRKNITIN